MRVIHPGPPSIKPGARPGGVVIHIYGVPSGKLLSTSKVAAGADLEARAHEDVIAANKRWVPTDIGHCLVAYDGDTGRRFTAEDWQ